MNLENHVGELVRVKDRRIVGRKHSAILLAVSHDGSAGYLRLKKTGQKISARAEEIVATAYGAELADRLTKNVQTSALAAR